jgi:hypothetical protein
VYTCAYAHVVINSIWHLTRRLVNVLCRYSTAWCIHKNCLLVVIISRIWDVAILVCFFGANGGSTLITLAIPCIYEATEVTQHHLCGYGGVSTSGCTVRFNPWYKNFISGLCSCENQPLCSWLIVKLLSLLWVKNCKWSHWKPFCGLQYSTGLSCFVS